MKQGNYLVMITSFMGFFNILVKKCWILQTSLTETFHEDQNMLMFKEAFLTCVYCMLLHFQRNFIGTNQRNFFENLCSKRTLKTRSATWLNIHLQAQNSSIITQYKLWFMRSIGQYWFQLSFLKIAKINSSFTSCYSRSVHMII